MRLVCLKNEFVSKALEYTLSHILNQLGYFFEWLDSAEQARASDLLITYAPQTSAAGSRQPAVFLPRLLDPQEIRTQDITWQECELNGQKIPVFALKEQKSTDGKSYFCDLIANVYFHLARLEESDLVHPDRLDDARAEKSILFKYGQFCTPVVDLLIEDFGRFLEGAVPRERFLIRKAPYPGGEDFGLAFTHDVDRIAAFHRPTKFLFKLLNKFGLYKKHSPQEMDRADRDSWGFDRLLPFYLEKKIKATFFFISRFREGRHFRYLLGRKKMRQLLERLLAQGHEIALHPSRFAFEHPARYAKEKKRLEKLSGFSVKGMRHHYLRGLFPQLWQQAFHLGLQYEAGMIHRHYSGFRSATCCPFYTFDHKARQALPLVAFPTVFFENTLPEEGRNVKASLQKIETLLQETKKHQGLFTVLWHTNNIFYNEPYPQLWQSILKMLEKESVFLAPLQDHYKWFEQRKQIKLRHEGNKLQITVPKGLIKFSLLLPDNHFQFECEDEGVQLSFKRKCLTVTNGAELSSINVTMFRL